MDNSITIRAANPGDLSRIAALAESSGLFPASYLPPMIQPFLHDPETADLWLVAEGESDLLAFCFCEPERMTEGTVNMLALATEPSRRSEGIGATLVATLEERCQLRGDRLMLVETAGLPQFERTRAFYSREGYSQIAMIPDFYDVGEDKVIFSKAIS